MAQQIGRISIRTQVPIAPESKLDIKDTVSDLVRWARDFHRAIVTTMYDNLQKALVFGVNNSGVQAFGAADTTKVVAFDGREVDTSYQLALVPNWNTAVWATGKTQTGVTINVSAAPGGTGGNIDWTVVR